MNILPLVSVVIPTYARAIYIRRAIDSVLNQTYPNIEIIVVDDNGKGTAKQIETQRQLQLYIDKGEIIYICHDINRNASAARNTGIYNSRGEYICFLDDDDEYFSDKLERQVAVLSTLGKNWAGVYCNSIDKFEGGKNVFIQNKVSEDLLKDLLLCKTKFGSTSLMIRREVCMELHGFGEYFYRHQDWEFLVRLLLKYQLKLVDPQRALIYYYVYKLNNNRPKGLSYLTYREQYLMKYEREIMQLEYGNLVYYYHYYSVARILLGNSCFKQGFFLFHRACSRKTPSVKDYFLILKSALKGLICYCKRNTNVL